MKQISPQYITGWFAVGLTAFLLGGGVTAWKLTANHHQKIGDRSFLEKQLSQLEPTGTGAASSGTSRGSRQKKVRTEVAIWENLGATRLFSGRLVEIQRSTIAAETTGPIIAMPLEVGMRVKKEETLIAQVDTIWAKLTADQAKQMIEVSQVQLSYAKRELDRFNNLSLQGIGYVSESDMDSQRLRISELEANIALQTVVQTEAEKKLERSKIYAPYNGVVVRKISEVGAFVSPGTPLVEIVSTGLIDAELLVSESFIDRLKIGDSIPIWIESLGIEATGTIFSIVPYGSTAARSFPVRIRLDDQAGRLKVGMSLRGRIQITEPRDSIVVSKDAVLDRPDGAIVWVVRFEQQGATSSTSETGDKSGQVLPVPVTITAKTESQYAVLPITPEGREILIPGAVCVVEGADRLIPNDSVLVVVANPDLLLNPPKASGHTIIEPMGR